MPAHITPLTRNQLLELESLMNALGHDASSRPASTLATVEEDERAAQMASETRGFAACRGPELSSSPSSMCPPLTQAALLAHDRLARGNGAGNNAAQEGHAMLQGRFVDVLRDPVTKLRWRVYDKMLYLVWWSHRPACCAQCGMREAWVPSAESEVRCAHCGAGAGSTEWNDIVEDMPSASASAAAGGGSARGHGSYTVGGGGGGNNNEDRDEDGDWSGGEDGANGGYGPGEESSQGAVSSYLFFYEWLERVRHILHLDAADESTPTNNNNSGGRAAGLQSAAQPHLLPEGEALTAVLRAAYDMSGLLVLPGMSVTAHGVVRAGCLYLSLMLHRYAVPFPLYRLAASSSMTTTTTTTSTSDDETAEQLQWVDVEYLALLLGVSLADYFESGVVAAQYLQNVMAVAADYAVPSLLWHPERVAGRMAYILSLRPPHLTTSVDNNNNNSNSSGTRASSAVTSSSGAGGRGREQDKLSPLERLSPEQMAMCVALELARGVDAAPLQHIATSSAAAVLHARRIGHWLDRLGLYPNRHVYRDVADTAEGNSNTARVKTGEEREEGTAGVREAAWWTTHAALEDDTFAALCCEEGQCDTPATQASAALTTPASPFAGRVAYILPSPCANALLHIFAAVFHTPALELAEMAGRSGIYRGPTRFAAVLEAAMRRGDYGVLPLARRLSPAVRSCWTPLYLALHSDSRLPLLATLQRLGSVENSTRERMNALGHVLQRLLRPHGAGQYYQFNYTLRVTDEAERHFNGIYFLSAWLPREGLATFTCLRSGRKTLTYNTYNQRISLCYLSAKERLVSALQVRVLSPIVACIEDNAVKAVMDAVTCGGPGTEQWTRVVQSLDRCGRVRRRMRVPMLASRLDALSSIREATAVAQHPIAGAATLLGWGETETILAAPPAVDLLRLRAELQENLFALPFAAMLYGLSENRVVAMYASLVALLEYIVSVQARQAQKEAAQERKRSHGNGGNSPGQERSGASESDKDEADVSQPPSGSLAPTPQPSPLSQMQTRGRRSRRRRRSAEATTEGTASGVTLLRTPPLPPMPQPDSSSLQQQQQQRFLTNWVEELLCEEDGSGSTRRARDVDEDSESDEEEEEDERRETRQGADEGLVAKAGRPPRPRAFTTTTTSTNSKGVASNNGSNTGRPQPGLYRRGLALTPRLSPRRGPALQSPPHPHQHQQHQHHRPAVLVRAIALTPPLAPEVNTNNTNNTSSANVGDGEEERAVLSVPPPFMLSASTGEMEAVGKRRPTPRRRRRRHSPLPSHAMLQSCVMSYLEASLLPSYGEVLLGQATMPIVCDDADSVQQRLPATSQAMLSRRLPPGMSGAGNGSSGGGGGAHGCAKMPLEMGFTLFQAEECRVRLHRMHRFIAAYKAQRAALWAKARAGTLRPRVLVKEEEEEEEKEAAMRSHAAAQLAGATTVSPVRERKSRRLRHGERSPQARTVTAAGHADAAADKKEGSAVMGTTEEKAEATGTKSAVQTNTHTMGSIISTRAEPSKLPPVALPASNAAAAVAKSRRMTGRQRRRRERRQQSRREKYGSSSEDEGEDEEEGEASDKEDEGNGEDDDDRHAEDGKRTPATVSGQAAGRGTSSSAEEEATAEGQDSNKHEQAKDEARPASIRQRASAQADGRSLAASPSIRPACEDSAGARGRPKAASSSPSQRRGRERSKTDAAALQDEAIDYDADADN